jgi:hypothetical protein
MDDRTYTIADSPDYFRAGVVPSGNQVIIGSVGSEAVCLCFSTEGDFLMYYTRPLKDITNSDALRLQVETWLEEIGFSAGEVVIHQFSLPDLSISIQELPEYLEKYAVAPGSFSSERQIHLSARLKEWRQSGAFVFNWIEEYEMSATGEVEST